MQRIYEPENLLEGQMLLDMLAQGQHLAVLPRFPLRRLAFCGGIMSPQNFWFEG